MTESSRGDRRDFLRGKSAGRALQQAAQHALESTSEGLVPLDRSFLLSVRRRAMACDFEIQIPADGRAQATDHCVEALDLIESLEAQMTVYRSDSEILQMNRAAADRPVAVEPRLFGVLQMAQHLYRETDGALDATSGPLSAVWGFSRRQGRLPADEEIDMARARVGFDAVRLDAERQEVSFQHDGIELNLNSIGKGYALDRAAELLEAAGVRTFLFHGGKSSVLARGGLDAKGRGWQVGLRHPLRPAEQLAEFRLCDEALATSGSATQHFRHQGKQYGHILDPRTGRPAEGVLSATVIAPSAAEADALSTAFYVMGPEAVDAYCEARPQIKSLVVCPATRAGEVQLHFFNLDD